MYTVNSLHRCILYTVKCKLVYNTLFLLCNFFNLFPTCNAPAFFLTGSWTDMEYFHGVAICYTNYFYSGGGGEGGRRGHKQTAVRREPGSWAEETGSNPFTTTHLVLLGKSGGTQKVLECIPPLAPWESTSVCWLLSMFWFNKQINPETNGPEIEIVAFWALLVCFCSLECSSV